MPRATATCWRLCRATAAAEHAFVGPDGTKLADALDELAISEAAAGLPIAPSDYVELFSAARCRPGGAARRRSPALRVRILGLARSAPDRKAIAWCSADLVEGAWPPESRTDAWLSRPMRLELGLDLPERRIGLSAHDFAQCSARAR